MHHWLGIPAAPRAHPRRSLARPGCVSAPPGPPGHRPGESPALAPRPSATRMPARVHGLRPGVHLFVV